MSTVLIVSHEPLEERMSGPSIRNWELASVLSTNHDVTLAAPGNPGRSSAAFTVRGYNGTSLPDLIRAHEVVQASGYLLERHPALAGARHLVVDLYGPFPLENLHMHREAALEEQHAIAGFDGLTVTRLIQRGDMFLCASERQRDFWTGWLAAVGRVNPYVHSQDPSLGHLLRVVPFGISNVPPEPGHPRYRGVVPGIDADDFIVLWGGGIWNWFDPLTLIAAAAKVRRRLPRLRVVFPAPASPSPEVLPMRMAEEARRMADDLSLTGSIVFFGQGWVPYSERGALLREANVGVSLHRKDVETRFSFRTRVLDYLWAGLPILTTEGDSMADLVTEMGLGAVVPYQDVEAVADALVTLADDPTRLKACAERSAMTAKRFLWPEVARPLLDYCANPVPAADRGQPMPVVAWPKPTAQIGPGLVTRAVRAYKEGGLPRLLVGGARRLRARRLRD